MTISTAVRGKLHDFSLRSVPVHTIAVGAAASLAVLAIWFGLEELSTGARVALITFVIAVAGWVFTKINDTYIALVSVLLPVVLGVVEPENLFNTFGDPMIWLLFAAFIIAAGVKATGLSVRLTLAVTRRTRTVSQLFYGLTAAILATAFVIPATSGRAALLIPVFVLFSRIIGQPRISRALALLFPTTILLSAFSSLMGAGAHMVTADLLAQLSGEQITFGRWMLLGLPFALASCFTSTWVILRMFLSREERALPLLVAQQPLNELVCNGAGGQQGLSRREWYVTAVLLVLVILWLTEASHGLSIAVVALLGALAITLPQAKLISFKDALKGVEWNMLLFMAASMHMGEQLLATGAATWIAQNAFGQVGAEATLSPIALAALVALVSLLAHLLITSRTARSSVLVPVVVLVGAASGCNPVALAFLSTAAAGFCLTLPVSAKPVAMFATVEAPSFSAPDLLRLSMVLLPLHFGLLLFFALVVWPWLGMSLV